MPVWPVSIRLQAGVAREAQRPGPDTQAHYWEVSIRLQAGVAREVRATLRGGAQNRVSIRLQAGVAREAREQGFERDGILLFQSVFRPE